MSTAFTIDNTNWQELAKINEIQLAYSEHVQAIGGGAQANKTEGVDIQSAAFWNVYQNWLENNCDSFVNDGVVIVGENDITMFDVDTWRASAGLNASGFRRSTDGTNFSYGIMQEGDIIGDWIFDDLIKGFSALKWSARIINNCGGGAYSGTACWTADGEDNTKYGESETPHSHETLPPAWATAISIAKADYGHLSSENAPPCAWCAGGVYSYSSYPYWWNAAVKYLRRYAYARLIEVSSAVPHEVKLYTKHSEEFGYLVDAFWGNFYPAADNFFTNGDSVTEKLSLMQSWGESSDVSYESDRIGDNSLPIPADAPEPDMPPSRGESHSNKGYHLSYGHYPDSTFIGGKFILKWNFTNSD